MAEHDTKAMEAEEKKYFEKCIRCFRFYRKHALVDVKKALRDYDNLSEAHRNLLPQYRAQQKSLVRCIDVNYMFILHMLQDVDGIFVQDEEETTLSPCKADAGPKKEKFDEKKEEPTEKTPNSEEKTESKNESEQQTKSENSDTENKDCNADNPSESKDDHSNVQKEHFHNDDKLHHHCSGGNHGGGNHGNHGIHHHDNMHHHNNVAKTNSLVDTGLGLTMGDMDRVYTTLRQYVRDWSVEGKEEREKCYAPIIDAVIARYPDPKNVDILVPGAGLGRLAFDFASRGYNSEGNEFSIFMLIGSNFILNKMTEPFSAFLFPWATNSTNNLTHGDRIARVNVPDVDTTSIPRGTKFGMCAGDFTEVYCREENKFDVVAASFFLDTAHNIIQYLEIIYTILKPGGHFISLGPLLFHYAGMDDQSSIEIPWDDVERLLRKIGFKLEEVNDIHDVPYIQNKNSMLKVSYDCKFFIATKPLS